MSRLLRLPGLIDIHVHLRDPGQTYKEDFHTGTCSALAGGVTTIFDMPNNKEPIYSYKKLIQKIKIARKKAVCDWGLYFGTDGKNIDEFDKVKNLVIGLKVYLNLTTGRLLMQDNKLTEKVFKNWPRDKVIVVHAEGEKVDLAINLCKKYKNKIHITHISQKSTLEKIFVAKRQGAQVTCDVTPHHLFLSKDQVSHKDTSGVTRQSACAGKLAGFPDGGGIKVKPPLATKEDMEFLWENISKIDCIATDHAPHTIEEKKSKNPPSGISGLETMLPLLLTAVDEGKLTIEDIIRLTNSNPKRIFNLDQDENTYVDIDMKKEYTIKNENLFTKCGWSPFAGWKLKGKIKNVYIRGVEVFDGTEITVSAGFGRNISRQ